MLADSPISFSSPIALYIALAGLAAAISLALIRQIRSGVISRLLILTGLVCLTLAAGSPLWHRSTPRIVTVMVDLSPSTRGAIYRDRSALQQRIRELIGDTNYNLIAFADHNQPLPNSQTLPDIPADRTIFSPPLADAILLFSDGQFDLPPFAPRNFPVIDPALEQPPDAAVSRLEFRGQKVIATITNNGPPRSLIWSGAQANQTDPIPSDLIRSATPTAAEIAATLSPGDQWPENDSLSIHLPPPPTLEHWWIGSRNPGEGWKTFSPADLPLSPADYLQPAVIVLDNISADSLSTEPRDRLAQYVRDLGGGMVIVGGDQAFAAGGYDGTALDQISPLASSPPSPTTHWILLVDGSGSMADDAGHNTSKWQLESTAITRLLPVLPADDLVSTGSFAESLDWWSSKESARDTINLPLPPASASPHGPTNLQPALQQIISSADGSMPVQLLLMTDAETKLADIDVLAKSMSAKKIHLHVLAIARGSALPALKTIASTTGGSVIEQLDPQRWIHSARQLLRAAMPDRLSRNEINIHFTGDLAAPGTRTTDLWNRTWLKPTATLMANTDTAPIAAQWSVGAGHVAAIAYAASIPDIQKIAEPLSIPPRDPRFTITWQIGATLQISIDAIDKNAYLNGEHLQLELMDPSTTPIHSDLISIPQTAPGHYQIELPATRNSTIATIRDNERILERFPLPARYAPEFNAIGNDRPNLQALAAQSAGAVIEPGPARPIDFHWPVQEVPLTSLLATLGASLVATGLILWRRG